jgi:hypothetical protein
MYPSRESCTSDCGIGERWSCSSNGQCVPDPSGTSMFRSQNECQASCAKAGGRFTCDGNTQTCMPSASGEYDSSWDCNTNCNADMTWRLCAGTCTSGKRQGMQWAECYSGQSQGQCGYYADSDCGQGNGIVADDFYVASEKLCYT